MKIVLFVHMGDMIVAGNEKDSICLQEMLPICFPLKNMGPLTWCTGCTFEWDVGHGIVMTAQTSFIHKIIDRYKVPCTSPFPATVDCKLTPRAEDGEGGEWPCR